MSVDGLLTWLAENDACYSLQFLIVYNHFWVQWVESFGLLEVIGSLRVVFESFVAEGPSEVSVGIFRVLFDN